MPVPAGMAVTVMAVNTDCNAPQNASKKRAQTLLQRGAAGILTPASTLSLSAMAGLLQGSTLAPSPHWEKAGVSEASTENPRPEAWGERVVLRQRPNALEVDA